MFENVGMSGAVLALRCEEQLDNRKLALLRQIKLSVESLMLDSGSGILSGDGLNRSSWHSYTGVMAAFARHLLAVLEDGLCYDTFRGVNIGSGGAMALWTFVVTTLRNEEAATGRYEAGSYEEEETRRLARAHFGVVYGQLVKVTPTDSLQCTLSLSYPIFVNQEYFLMRTSILFNLCKAFAFL